MTFPVRAITLDLDDTLWPFAPIAGRIEHALDDWLREHCPATAARFPIPAMRALRETVAAAHPALAHDMTALRRLCIGQALREGGDDPALADAAFDVFFAARNRVDFYDDSLDALRRIAARVPVAALSNGNADLGTIGIDHLFAFQLGAREHGAAKPDPGIFLAACARLGCAPRDVLHVGDDTELDVLGAARAGLRTCWINRADAGVAPRDWPHAGDAAPDLAFDTLAALADWLDAHAASKTPRTAAA